MGTETSRHIPENDLADRRKQITDDLTKLRDRSRAVKSSVPSQYHQFLYEQPVAIQDMSPSFKRLARHTNPDLPDNAVALLSLTTIEHHRWNRFNRQELTVVFPDVPEDTIASVRMHLGSPTNPLTIPYSNAYERTGRELRADLPNLPEATRNRIAYLESLAHPENVKWQVEVVETILTAFRSQQALARRRSSFRYTAAYRTALHRILSSHQ